MQDAACAIDTVNIIRERRQPSRKPPKLSKTRTNSAIPFALVNAEPEEPKSLTYPQKMFCRAYVENKGNATKAAYSAYNCTNDSSAAATGSKLLTLPKIQKEIANIDAETRCSSITPELITSEIGKIALSDKANIGARVKSLELLARIKAMLIDRVEQRQTVVDKSIDLSALSTPQLLAALQARLRLSASGIRETQKPAELDAAPILDVPNDAVALGTVQNADQQVSEKPNVSDSLDTMPLSARAQCEPDKADNAFRPAHGDKEQMQEAVYVEVQSNVMPGGGGMPQPGPVGE